MQSNVNQTLVNSHTWDHNEAHYVREKVVHYLNKMFFSQIPFGALDFDECANATHNCDVDAVCDNTLGSYNCTCKDGFYGDGINCTGNYL